MEVVTWKERIHIHYEVVTGVQSGFQIASSSDLSSTNEVKKGDTSSIIY
jgi:hypothetical protein